MKIAAIECLKADAGSRNFDFLKITAENGLVGWSEFNLKTAVEAGPSLSFGVFFNPWVRSGAG